MAHVLARAGLCLGATTIRRMLREPGSAPDDEPEITRRRRRVVARYPGHTWHVDLTTVPTRAGFWVPWFPFALPQRWPFCWWVAVAIDQVSRACVGFAVFSKAPTSRDVQLFLDRAIRAGHSTPKYLVSDKGKQFWCRGYKSWCKRRGIRPRYGRIGEPAGIAIVERFIRSMKSECTRIVLAPLTLAGMRHELGLYAGWYNKHRPHMAHGGKTPDDLVRGNLRRRKRFEPRSRLPRRSRDELVTRAPVRLAVSYVERRRHLPVITLERAA